MNKGIDDNENFLSDDDEKLYQLLKNPEENAYSIMKFLPDEIKNTKFYDPGNNAREEELRKVLKKRWKNKYGY